MCAAQQSVTMIKKDMRKASIQRMLCEHNEFGWSFAFFKDDVPSTWADMECLGFLQRDFHVCIQILQM